MKVEFNHKFLTGILQDQLIENLFSQLQFINDIWFMFTYYTTFSTWIYDFMYVTYCILQYRQVQTVEKLR